MLIAIPTMGTIATPLAEWLSYQSMMHELHFTDTITPHSRARNTIVKYFLNETTHDALLMVDNDTIPPLDAVEKMYELIKMGAGVVTGVTPTLRGRRVVANVYRQYHEVEMPLDVSALPKIPFEVVGCGASCLMVSRATLQLLLVPYFKTIEFDNGAICSEDLFFCEQVRKNKLSIVAHPEVLCRHRKPILL